ncbi:dihydrofolate reductase [Rhabdaerophilum sp. SD176]|uniref:dihydrofolate reductase n=1 Tax=Rhabdaerophilum sp. SD176 TaxID=2983548 RepID=UPI0024DFCDCF|nr:dihydrofolate reductase [Rhabdaerophilum sp. SD176]
MAEHPAPGSGARIVIVAAVARNGVIGRDNRLLWRLKSDMRHFRALTMGKPILMGRKTFDSIGKPLPGRHTVVITRNRGWAYPGVVVAPDPESGLVLARALAEQHEQDEVIIGGGSEIYRHFLPRADRLEITEVDLLPDGDAVFPAIDALVWREASRQSFTKNADDEADFRFVTYLRR